MWAPYSPQDILDEVCSAMGDEAKGNLIEFSATTVVNAN